MALNKAITFLNSEEITEDDASATRTLGPTEGQRGYIGFVSVGAITGTDPTLDIKIQHSSDRTNWVDLLTFTQLTGSSDDTAAHKFPSSATDHLIPLLSYVRAIWDIGGSADPTFEDVVVKLFV